MDQQKDNFMRQAQEALRKGDKKIKGTFLGNLLSSQSIRAESALEYYKSAATNYKLAQEWRLASEAYQRCYDCDKKSEGMEAAELLIEAGNMLKKVNGAEGIKLLERASEEYCQEGRLVQAARIHSQIGEILENNKQYTLAVTHYQKSADLYYAESDYSSNYNKARLKVAELSCHDLQDSGSVIKAIKVLQEVAMSYLQNRLLAPSARELVLKAGLLLLSLDDQVGCSVSLQDYQDRDPPSANSREVKFISAILNAYKNNDHEAFSTACFEQNSIMPLDKFKTDVLTKIKNQMGNAVNHEAEDNFL